MPTCSVVVLRSWRAFLRTVGARGALFLPWWSRWALQCCKCLVLWSTQAQAPHHSCVRTAHGCSDHSEIYVLIVLKCFHVGGSFPRCFALFRICASLKTNLDVTLRSPQGSPPAVARTTAVNHTRAVVGRTTAYVDTGRHERHQAWRKPTGRGVVHTRPQACRPRTSVVRCYCCWVLGCIEHRPPFGGAECGAASVLQEAN